MKIDQDRYHLELRDMHRIRGRNGVDKVLLETNRGTIECRLHQTAGENSGVVWVGGVGGGLDGPAGGMYPRLAAALAEEGACSLLLAYRNPTDMVSSILDTMLGAYYLVSLGCSQVVLVGHSLGGAVVISAGAAVPHTVGVVTLSSQNYGTDQVKDLSPRPLLVIHGTQDQVLPDTCSRDIFRRARPPKELKLYPGCNHGLDECREEVDRDLLTWLRTVLFTQKSS